jgi:hypothetical protein
MTNQNLKARTMSVFFFSFPQILERWFLSETRSRKKIKFITNSLEKFMLQLNIVRKTGLTSFYSNMEKLLHQIIQLHLVLLIIELLKFLFSKKPHFIWSLKLWNVESFFFAWWPHLLNLLNIWIFVGFSK